MSGKALIVFALFALLAVGGGLWVSFGRPAVPSLAALETMLVARYSDIEHISTGALAERLAEGDDIVLLDAREAGEYAVSHIAGAIRVDPNAAPADVAALVGAQADGAEIVVYCSVGWRSSVLADRAAEALYEAGAFSVANLRGGVFAWHNEARPLMSAGGAPTEAVHPYDQRWGRLVERQHLLAHAPKS